MGNAGASSDDLENLLTNPETYREYSTLEPEYKIIRQVIKGRTSRDMIQAALAIKPETRRGNSGHLESSTCNPSLCFLK